MRGGKEAPKKTGANDKDPEQGRWRQQAFFPGKKNKKAEWMFLSKDGGRVLYPLMFYNSKGGEDYTTKLITSENLQPSV